MVIPAARRICQVNHGELVDALEHAFNQSHPIWAAPFLGQTLVYGNAQPQKSVEKN
jgi:hypothetical protein